MNIPFAPTGKGEHFLAVAVFSLLNFFDLTMVFYH